MPYLETGRTNQKQRTRDVLVDAARALIRGGVTPTVEQAASHAGISRTTAYRYFQNQRELLVAAHPMIDMGSLLPESPPSDPQERLALVLDAHLRLTVENEQALRTAFLLSLDTSVREAPVLRRGPSLGCSTRSLLCEADCPTPSCSTLRERSAPQLGSRRSSGSSMSAVSLVMKQSSS